MKALKKIDTCLATFLKGAVIFMCSAIAIILFLRVLIRFTPLTISLSWTDEIVEMLMAWMIFTASTLIMRDKAHFRVDILQSRFNGKAWMDFVNILITIVSLLFIGSLLYYGADLVNKSVQFTPILKIPVKYLYASIPVNCFLMLLYLVRDLVEDILTFVNGHIRKQAA